MANTMNYRLRILQILTALVCGVLLCFHFWDFIWTQSVDLAHHYALVSRLTEFGDLPRIADPSLGEMQTYPRLGHRIAAHLGHIWRSPLAGMQIAVLASMIALWTAMGWMFWSQPLPQARRATLTALLALLVGGFSLHLDLWGREMVGSYFYSQFVAQAASLAILAIALTLSQAGWSRFVIYGFLIVGIFVVELIHLLPAMELLGFLGLLVLFDHLRQPGRWTLRNLITSAVFPIAGLFAVVVNPTFGAMATISEINGRLFLTFVPNFHALLALVLVTIASSIWGMRFWLKLNSSERQQEQLVVAYFAILGLSISILCLLQLLALKFGFGSEYACRKYAFGLWTVLLANISLLLMRASEAERRTSVRLRWVWTLFDCCAVGLLVAAATLAIFPSHKSLSLTNLMSLERRLDSLKAHEPAAPAGRYIYATQLPGEPPMIDYLFSIGVFKTARSDNAYDILSNRDLSRADEIGTIVTRSNGSRYDIPACRLPSPDPAFTLIDGTCYAKMEHEFCRGEMHLTDSSLTQGFSSPKWGGAWTDAKTAIFHCKMPDYAPDYPDWVRISGFAFVRSAHAQHVNISVNGSEARELVFDRPDQKQSMVFAVPKGTSDMQIKFLLPDAVSPSAMGVSNDPRELGFFVQSIQFLKGQRPSDLGGVEK